MGPPDLWRAHLHWSGWRDLNPRPLRPERSALPSCATPRYCGTSLTDLGPSSRNTSLHRAACTMQCERMVTMSALKERLHADLTTAMKARDEVRTRTLR